MSGTSLMPGSGNQQASHRQMMRRGDDIDPFVMLRGEMNRVFDDLLRGFGMPSVPPPAFGRSPAAVLAPHVDVSESDREVRITAELPGITEQEVEVSLSDDLLTIRGDKRVVQEERDRNYRIVERARGSFSRSLRLPFRIDPSHVQATMKDGILTITIPKPRELQERASRIEVTRHDGAGASTPAAAAGSVADQPSSPDPASARESNSRRPSSAARRERSGRIWPDGSARRSLSSPCDRQ